METRQKREEFASCNHCHGEMFSIVDRVERGRRGVNHVYRIICENCGAETESFLTIRRGDFPDTVTGVMGEEIHMRELEEGHECVVVQQAGQ